MNKFILLIISIFSFNSSISKESFYDIKINSIEGKKVDFSEFKGKYVLIVNVASSCGFTPQYKDLQKLQDQFKNLVVIGVPCNQFGYQEPGNEKQIMEFCSSNYNITFLMTEKINVKGDNKHPLYQWLTSKSKNGTSNSTVQWNFQKYLVDNNGRLVNYFYSTTNPLSKKITNLLTQ